MAKGIIIVVGGGFAGLTAAEALRPLRKYFEIRIIDRKPTSDFLPCLPDIIGRKVHPKNLVVDLKSFCDPRGLTFVNEEVIRIDLNNHKVYTSQNNYAYDYLIAAPGAETNFYGHNAVAAQAYTLSSVEGIMRIQDRIANNNEGSLENFIIAGGGYTGIEIATNLWRYYKLTGKEKRIIIVEKSGSLLGPLPSWMKDYTLRNLQRMGIEVLFNCGVEDVGEGTVALYAPQGRYQNAMLIWTAGVKAPDFIQDLPCSKGPQGRVTVDPYLRVDAKTFVLGDCAFIEYNAKPLRMGIQFSIAQGQLAAQNIKRSIGKRPLKMYKPLDLGYVVPMANNFSCGQVLGINMKGVVPTLLHYFMCIYRSWTYSNRWSLLRNLVGC